MTGFTIGDRRWAAERDGALTPSELSRFVLQTVRVQAADWSARLLSRLRPGAATTTLELIGSGAPPDTDLAADVLRLAADTYPSRLLGHCLRCWYWADLFARLDRISYDPELLFASCLLHDIALPASGGAASCFAVEGGRIARAHLLQRGRPEDFAERVAEAITLHMNAQVPAERGAEAHLLHAAAHLDVAGTRARHLPPAHVREILQRHPRDGFAEEFERFMRREARARPRSRAAVSWRLGMAVPLHHNPIDLIDAPPTA
ncbi:HD domain-containing protein [Thermomonospora umbrina]|uniref:HD domain-containing protein n=1 Tax=Thermomonospora umbrina TaxID=111806 RepID=A0A3D9SQ71_9ACTN|nr:HD domain-containing protein [Thermomonospora umbrina]REE97767.1 HD domain-containing protein [Thermomonospora umbrina]